jgi:SAM-dependent methyltransferase
MLLIEVGDLQDKIYNFWKNHSLANIKPKVGEEWPEGWDVTEFFRNFMTEEEYGQVIEIGCGYGRLCTAFNKDKYLGLDISYDALRRATKIFPNYKFKLIEEEDLNNLYQYSNTKFLYTVLLHQTDEDIEDMVKNLCMTSDTIIVAEIMGRDWRRQGNPPVFNREVGEYEALFSEYDKGLSKIVKRPYTRYKDWPKIDTDITIMVFRD